MMRGDCDTSGRLWVLVPIPALAEIREAVENFEQAVISYTHWLRARPWARGRWKLTADLVGDLYPTYPRRYVPRGRGGLAQAIGARRRLPRRTPAPEREPRGDALTVSLRARWKRLRRAA